MVFASIVSTPTTVRINFDEATTVYGFSDISDVTFRKEAIQSICKDSNAVIFLPENTRRIFLSIVTNTKGHIVIGDVDGTVPTSIEHLYTMMVDTIN